MHSPRSFVPFRPAGTILPLMLLLGGLFLLDGCESWPYAGRVSDAGDDIDAGDVVSRRDHHRDEFNHRFLSLAEQARAEAGVDRWGHQLPDHDHDRDDGDHHGSGDHDRGGNEHRNGGERTSGSGSGRSEIRGSNESHATSESRAEGHTAGSSGGGGSEHSASTGSGGGSSSSSGGGGSGSKSSDTSSSGGHDKK